MKQYDKNEMIELKLDMEDIDDIFQDIVAEMLRAESMFPGWPEDPVHGAAIVGEEAGELTQAALQWTYQGGKSTDMVKEAIHTAAMAFRFLLYMQRVDRRGGFFHE